MNQKVGYTQPRARVETLVDLIFGLSLSIGAVALIATPPSSTAEINERILAFVFIAAFVITSWMVYTYQMSVLPVETNFVIYLNVIMLILIAMIPFLLYNVENVFEPDTIRDYSSSLFAIDLTAILLILTTFSHVISIEEKRLVAPELAKRFRDSRNVQAVLALVTIVSLAPVFWTLAPFNVPLRLYIWTIPVIVYWVRRARQGREPVTRQS